MIVFLDTCQDLDICSAELGYPVEEFFTPLTNRNSKRPEQHFAMDNGAFSKFEAKVFLSLLKKHEPRKDLCRFVAAPDVVGSARRTSECFKHWQPRLVNWPVAYVCQDGQEDLDIPWDYCTAVFIGGSTKWKESEFAAQIVKASKVIGKWCHVGRVNTPERLEHFENLGADSIDGTGLARYSHMRNKIQGSKLQNKFEFNEH